MIATEEGERDATRLVERDENRVEQFPARWAGETYEKGESQTFWSEFLSIFGIDRRRHGAFFEYAIKKTGNKQGFIDLFWPGKLLAQGVLDARAVDRLYQRKPFASDADRVALLFKRYQALTS